MEINEYIKAKTISKYPMFQEYDHIQFIGLNTEGLRLFRAYKEDKCIIVDENNKQTDLIPKEENVPNKTATDINEYYKGLTKYYNYKLGSFDITEEYGVITGRIRKTTVRVNNKKIRCSKIHVASQNRKLLQGTLEDDTTIIIDELGNVVLKEKTQNNCFYEQDDTVYLSCIQKNNIVIYEYKDGSLTKIFTYPIFNDEANDRLVTYSPEEKTFFVNTNDSSAYFRIEDSSFGMINTDKYTRLTPGFILRKLGSHVTEKMTSYVLEPKYLTPLNEEFELESTVFSGDTLPANTTIKSILAYGLFYTTPEGIPIKEEFTTEEEQQRRKKELQASKENESKLNQSEVNLNETYTI